MFRTRHLAAHVCRRYSKGRSLSESKSFRSGNVLEGAVQKLVANGVPDPEVSAKLLYEASKGNHLVFDQFIERRTKREPLQYIIGDWDFHNITLLTRAPILIPRPETEELVEFVLSREHPKTNTSVLDIGTGTGAIGLALCHANQFINCLGIDSDPVACELAKENASKLGLSDKFVVRNIPVQELYVDLADRFDFIVSNPPYIPSNELSSLQPEVGLYESQTALDGGTDGGAIPRLVILRAFDLLKEGGSLFLELHYSHNQVVVDNWARSLGVGMVLMESRKDMQGIERFHRLTKISTIS